MYKRYDLTGITKQVYDYIFEHISSGEYPAGVPLSEVAISKAVNASRSPVREAMSLLENQGLLYKIPGKGCFVSELTSQDIQEIFDLRIALEIAALRRAYTVIRKEELEQVIRELQGLEPVMGRESYFKANRSLHELIISNSGNVRLAAQWNNLNLQLSPLRYQMNKSPWTMQSSAEEHLKLAQALQRGTLEDAEACVIKHLENARNRIMDFYLKTKITL